MNDREFKPCPFCRSRAARIIELERIEEAARAWKAARDKRGQYMNECDALNAALEDGDE